MVIGLLSSATWLGLAVGGDHSIVLTIAERG
jgi:hypothetical protein